MGETCAHITVAKRGADLSLVWPRLAVWLLDVELAAYRSMSSDAVVALYLRRIAGEEPTRNEWEAAWAAAGAARAAAWAARYDIGALRACDACVLVLPSGRSASWEFGYAMGQGKRGAVVQFDTTEPELMFREAEIITTMAELVDAFALTR